MEAKEQFDRGVLWDTKYHNGIINLRTSEKHLSEELKEKLRNDHREPNRD